ncbi:unnamed protein product [Amaranthus hypochondriacus]
MKYHHTITNHDDVITTIQHDLSKLDLQGAPSIDYTEKSRENLERQYKNALLTEIALLKEERERQRVENQNLKNSVNQLINRWLTLRRKLNR